MNSDYHSYLVRIWRPDPSGRWRILVESIASRERHGIRDWNELLSFFQQDANQTDATAEHSWSDPSTRNPPTNGSDSVIRNIPGSTNSSAARNATWNADDSIVSKEPRETQDDAKQDLDS